jgi:hypothetical protein
MPQAKSEENVMIGSFKGIACLTLSAALLASTAHAQDCGFRHAFDRPDERGTAVVHVYEGQSEPALQGARPLLFVTSLKVNTDGTRISYNVQDPRAQTRAINDIRNAMHSGHTVAEFQAIAAAGWRPTSRTWQILSDGVIEQNAQTHLPCVDHDGYLVSMTSDVAVDGGWGRVGDCDQSKWIDALTVPAIVLPLGHTQFRARGAVMRSPAIALSLSRPGHAVAGIVGDSGPAQELGEASVEMNRMLNGLPDGAVPANAHDAIARFQAGRSAVLIFPGARNLVARPLTAHQVATASGDLFTQWGGEARLRSCLATIAEAR